MRYENKDMHKVKRILFDQNERFLLFHGDD